ncbi:hypothetical protein NP493_2605g00000 [Ridgeia piscesae]|uniref:Uncharacterized protein n=1 Tax=Ridgeia piscesae TaxID=27915 RepID=A0AAD9JF80_RIDPI|nr:hypothetical protein NP493_2605g00000 [Ridgeia piscesae]
MADIDVIDLNEVAIRYAEKVLGVANAKKGNSPRRRFKSTYTNKSDEPQENTFSAQNTTKASTYVSLEQCFSIGEQTKLDLRLPEHIITAKSGFGHDLSSLEPMDISEIVKSVKDHNLLAIPDFVEIDGRTVCVTSTGRCEFIYGKEQHVTTAQE